MSVNSSFNSSFSDTHHSLFSNSIYLECQNSTASIIITVYAVTNTLLLPLYIFVLYMGFQRWRCQRSVPAGTTMSHADFLTYHMVIVEIFGIFGSVFYALGMYTNNVTITMLGVYLFCIIFPGQSSFHCLTCVEHYLAIVHPITYLRLRETGGVRIRNISTGCVWVLCCGWVGVTKLSMPDFPVIPFLSWMGILAIVVLFCCLSALRALTHPGPGEVGGHKKQVAQSKQRAFHIICAITGVLLFKFVALLICFGLYKLPSISQEHACVLMDFGDWLSLPSSLVLPLLFLHRAGKLPCCRQSTESAQGTM